MNIWTQLAQTNRTPAQTRASRHSNLYLSYWTLDPFVKSIYWEYRSTLTNWQHNRYVWIYVPLPICKVLMDEFSMIILKVDSINIIKNFIGENTNCTSTLATNTKYTNKAKIVVSNKMIKGLVKIKDHKTKSITVSGASFFICRRSHQTDESTLHLNHNKLCTISFTCHHILWRFSPQGIENGWKSRSYAAIEVADGHTLLLARQVHHLKVHCVYEKLTTPLLWNVCHCTKDHTRCFSSSRRHPTAPK